MTDPIYVISYDGKILRSVADGDLQEKIPAFQVVKTGKSRYNMTKSCINKGMLWNVSSSG